MEAYDMDEVYRALGTWGKFQVWHVVFIVIDVFPEAFAILSAVFTGYIPEYTCGEVQNQNLTNGNNASYTSFENEHCSYNVLRHEGNQTSKIGVHDCDEFSYTRENTYATEWNLVCSRTNLAALAQSLVLAGQGIGAFTMSHLADRYGRKTVHVISHIGVLFTMATMAFSYNIYMLLALRLVAGTFQQGMVCTGKILTLEMFPKEVRSYMEVLTFLAWTGGIMSLTLFGYLFREMDWRYLQIAIACFSLYAVVEWWILEESVRWLLSNGKMAEAERILKKACRWNNVEYSKIESILKKDKAALINGSVSTSSALSIGNNTPDMEMNTNGFTKPHTNGFGHGDNNGATDVLVKPAKAHVEKYTVLDILKNPALRVNTLILWYTWIVATGTYYGLTLVSTHLAGDRFVNFFLSGLLEIPSLLSCFYLFNKIGRKKTMIMWYAIAGVSLIVSTTLLTVLSHISAVNTLATIFSLIGKMAITGSFSTVFLYTPEIYPTNYRNSGLGIASSVSRIGGILAPFASNLALIAMWIPGAIFGGMCLLVTLLALRLPESAKHELPKSIADCDAWDNSSSSSLESSEDSEMVSMKA